MRVVLAYGFPGFVKVDVGEAQIEYFKGVAEDLRANFPDLEVIQPKVDALGDVATRAKQMAQFIPLTGELVHIIAHSAGGLDARYLVSPDRDLKLASRVRSITTISTPHQGTVIADIVAGLIPEAAEVVSQLKEFADGVRGLTRREMKDFNRDTPDSGDVAYFSYAGEANQFDRGILGSIFSFSFPIVSALEGPNDGWVSVRSAKRKIFKRKIHADHAEEVGHDLSPIGAFLDLVGDAPFDHKEFYRGIVADLRKL